MQRICQDGQRPGPRRADLLFECLAQGLKTLRAGKRPLLGEAPAPVRTIVFQQRMFHASIRRNRACRARGIGTQLPLDRLGEPCSQRIAALVAPPGALALGSHVAPAELRVCSNHLRVKLGIGALQRRTTNAKAPGEDVHPNRRGGVDVLAHGLHIARRFSLVLIAAPSEKEAGFVRTQPARGIEGKFERTGDLGDRRTIGNLKRSSQSIAEAIGQARRTGRVRRLAQGDQLRKALGGKTSKGVAMNIKG